MRLVHLLPAPSPRRLWDVARSRFWALPALFVVVSIGVAAGFVALDHDVGQVRDAFLYPGPPGGARTFLQAIIEAMITVTGTVFSVSVVALQLANGQLSSRIVPVYLRDLTVQATLGQFMATFVYTMVVLRSVGSGTGGQFVPRIAITVSFVFVMVSVGLFIAYINRISNLLRVADIVARVGRESRRLLDRRYPDDRPPPAAAPPLPPELATLPAHRGGVVVSVNEERLVSLAEDSGCALVLLARVGDYVPQGAPLVSVRGPADGPARHRGSPEVARVVRRAVAQDIERTMQQDLAFGMRQLVDIAEKALSPALNDPTTAAQCLDELHDLLRALAARHLPDGGHADGSGQVRLVVPQYHFSDFLEVALSEIWRYGSDAAQIGPRIRVMLDDLATVAVPEHRAAVRSWMERVDGGGRHSG